MSVSGAGRQAKYRAAHPERVRESLKRWRDAHPEYQKRWEAEDYKRHPEKKRKKRARRRVWHRKNAARLNAEYREKLKADPKLREASVAKVREIRRRNPWSYRCWQYKVTPKFMDALLEVQGGRCAICAEPLQKGPKAFLDHDHKTGTPRGLLCRFCNGGLGFFRDNPARLIAAILYLQNHHEDVARARQVS